MGPGVTGDLMTTDNHPLNEFNPGQARIINWTLAVVDASNEESRWRVVTIEKVKEITSVTSWTVIESQSNSPRNSARANLLWAIGNPANVRTGNLLRWWPHGGLVCVAGAEVKPAVGRTAVSNGGPTEAWFPALGKHWFESSMEYTHQHWSSKCHWGMTRNSDRIGSQAVWSHLGVADEDFRTDLGS